MLHCTFTGPQTPPWFQDQTAKLMLVAERRRTRARAEPVKLDPEVDRGDDKTELKDRQVTMDVLRVAVGPWCTQVERWHTSPQTAQAAQHQGVASWFRWNEAFIYIVPVMITCMTPPYSHCLNIYPCEGGLSIGLSQMCKQREGLQSLWLSACLEIRKFSGRALGDLEFVWSLQTVTNMEWWGDQN